MELCWSGEAGEPVPDGAADADRAGKGGIEVTNRDGFAKAVKPSKC